MIEINNLTAKPIKTDFLKRIAEKVLNGEKKKKIGLSIALIGRERMKKINKMYRGKDRVTDVLSFCQEGEMPDITEYELGLGEILICLKEVEKNAKKDNLTFNEELTRVLIHGILHLLKYDHEKSEQEADQMRKKEKYYSLNYEIAS